MWLSSRARRFDTDGDGRLELREFRRAFRALGLEKRSGAQAAVDLRMFRSFDSNGDGYITLQEVRVRRGRKPCAGVDRSHARGRPDACIA